MTSPAPATLRQRWSRLAARVGQVRRRPLILNIFSVLQHVPFRPLQVNCMYFLEYDGPPEERASYLRGRAEIRSATLQDLEGLTRCQNWPHLFRKRFEAGDHCAVAVLDGRIIGYQWFCGRPSYIEERYAYPIQVPADAIYAYDIFIQPEHRLAGIWFKFHCLYLRGLMERLGRRRIIGMVDYGNRLAMNTHLRFGFKPFRRVVVVKMFGRSWFREKPLHGADGGLPAWLAHGDDARPERRSADPARRPVAGREVAPVGAVRASSAPEQG
jgi:hypothetical protein